MSNDLKQNFEYRIDELVSRISTLRRNDTNGSLDDTISDLNKYLCVLISGYFEKVLVNQIINYSSNRTAPEIQHFLMDQLKHTTNIKKKKLEEILNGFTTIWVDGLKSWIDYDEFCASLGTIYDNRNKIAHGDSTSIGIQTLLTSYNYFKSFFDELSKVMYRRRA